MTQRVWAYVFAALVMVAVLAVWTIRSGAQPLRSQHARPAVTSTEGAVFVSAEGNLFHAAACKDLHQPAQTMAASEAVARGYAPCTRCMRRALGR